MAIRRAVLKQACTASGYVFLLAWQVFAPATAVAQQDRSSRTVESGVAVLAGNRNPNATVENDRGLVNPSQAIVGMSVVFKPSTAQAADLAILLQEQQDPNSPNYHAWLTQDQYADRFGLSPTDLAAVVSWIQLVGFRVDYVSQSRTWILFSGTAGQVQSGLNTELHRYVLNGVPHFANATDPSIPSALAPFVLLIRGLDDFRIEPPNAGVTPSPNFTTGGSHALVPGDVGTIYDINPLYQRGFNGSGQKIAVVGQTDIHLSDIEYFRAQYGLPANNPQLVLVSGSQDPGISPDDLIESSLDLEYSGAIAPDATIIFVYSTDVLTSAAYAIDQDLAPVISMSYGACEAEISSAPASTGAYLQSLAEQGNSLGITWLASSGDSGAAACDTGAGVHAASLGLAVNLPASVPQVTAVGGTEFNEGSGTYWSATNGANGSSALSYIPEKAWNDSATSVPAGDGLAATGGGASMLFPKPAWQAGTGVPNDSARDVPDLAFDAANDHDPYVMYVNGAFMYVGGTSVSTPVFSGILALLNQYLVANGALSQPGLGNINPTLYRLAQTATGVFHDITVGNNIVPCVTGSPDCTSGQMGYSAGVGYDQTTGLGSADANNLVTGWTVSLEASTTTSVLANPTSIVASGNTVLTATVSAVSGTTSPAGTISFTAGSTALGSGQLNGTGGSATATLTINGSQLSSGSNVISASYSGSATFLASSASVTVTVSASCTYSLNSTAASVGLDAANGMVDVLAGGGCSWAASSNAAWLTISSGSAGSGDGTVDFSFTANPGTTARVGILTIAGQSFTVTQSATSSPLGFYPLTPCRIADTRAGSGFSGYFGAPYLSGGSTRSFPIPASACDVPTTAQAYSFNITVIPHGALGYLSAWPTGSPQPLVATVNSPEGYVVGNAAIVAAGTGGAISLFATDDTDVVIDINGYFAAASAQSQDFYPVTPCRVADTRASSGFSDGLGPPSLVADGTRSFPVQSSSCEVPSSAEAYSMRMTVVAPAPLGYITAWPVGQPLPLVATLNAPNGGVIGNQAIVPAGTAGAIDVFASGNTDLVIDLNGYFAAPGSGGLHFYTLPPCRVADTRSGSAGSGITGAFGPPSLVAGATRDFPMPTSFCGIPSTAQAYSLNLTVVAPEPLGYLTAWPTGQPFPLASTLNANASTGGTVSAGAIVPAGTDGAISVFALNTTDLVIDINGYFAP